MPEITIPIPANDIPLVLSHREVSWFVREVIDWKNGAGETGHRHYKTQFHEAQKILKSRGVKFKPFSLVRQQNFIAKGFDDLDEVEIDFLLKALEHAWLPLIPPETLVLLADRAREAGAGRASRPAVADNYPLRPGSYAKLLGLKTVPQGQKELQKLVGDYLILRRLRERTVVVSHMHIQQDPAARHPATFSSRNFDVADTGEYTGEKNTDLVEGIMYVAPEQPGVVFAVGKYVGTTQTRSTLLKPVLKPVFGAEDMRMDLRGIRLGLNWPHREPMAYRIWCSHVPTEIDVVGGWSGVSRAYPLSERATDDELREQPDFRKLYGRNPHDFFSERVRGFDNILRWLSDRAFVDLGPERPE